MSHTRALWTQGSESGRQVVALGLAGALTIVAIDFSLVGRLSLFFDLSFVTLCLALAALVRHEDSFTVGLLPPVLMVGVFTLLGLVSPDVIARPEDGIVQAVVAGLAHHSVALLAGYALCLGLLAHRRRDATPGSRSGHAP